MTNLYLVCEENKHWNSFTKIRAFFNYDDALKVKNEISDRTRKCDVDVYIKKCRVRDRIRKNDPKVFIIIKTSFSVCDTGTSLRENSFETDLLTINCRYVGFISYNKAMNRVMYDNNKLNNPLHEIGDLNNVALRAILSYKCEGTVVEGFKYVDYCIKEISIEGEPNENII